MKRLFWMPIFFLGVVMPAAAQNICPPDALLSLVRAAAVCQDIGRDVACYGNGTLNPTFQADVSDIAFGTPGDVVETSQLLSLSAATASLEEPDYAVSTITLRADIPDPEQRNITMLLYGNAELINEVPSTPQFAVTSTGTLNIRALPSAASEILEQIQVRDSAVANGRTDDGAWLRVLVPGTTQLGWVSADLVQPDGNPGLLAVVDTQTPFYRPFQLMTLRTTTEPVLCDGTSDSGLLLQTPNTVNPVYLAINGVDLQVTGTLFVTAPDENTLAIDVIDGGVDVEVGDTRAYAPVGARMRVSNDILIEPYTPDALSALPVNNLPQRVTVGPAPSQADIEAVQFARAQPTPTVVPIVTATPNPCQIIARRNAPLRAGPDTFYEIINEAAAGQSLILTVQTRGTAGNTWYQLDNNNWIAAADVSISDACESIPATTFVDAPSTNFVSLETCESSNGPLREGQTVTFEFRPPAWETLAEAENAINTDRGSINVETERLRVRYSQPIRIADERYIRTFSATWEARAGGYRVTGGRLSYILTCDLTVRVN